MKKDKKNLNPVVRLVRVEIEDAIKNRRWRELKEAISTWHPSDIADLFREIEVRDRVVIFRLLPKDLQLEVFSYLESYIQEEIIKGLGSDHVKSIIMELEPDDRTELFEEMPPHLTRTLINLLPSKERKVALQLLGYPEDSVGRLMTPDYVTLRDYWTIKKAMQHIRKFGKDAETIDIVYVVDDEWHLLDDIPIRRLILAPPEQSVRAIMDHQFVSITAGCDQQEATKLFERYDIVALPVTDSEGHLLGIVTVDDIIDALREEQTEDFTKFSGIEADQIGLDFITRMKDVPLGKIFRARITWLFALLIMDLVTGGIIQGFEKTIARYVVLVTFLPVLVDTAGNAGSQSATLVIRSLALGTVRLKDWSLLLCREILISGMLGITMGLGISIMGFIRGKSILIAQVVVLSMIINVIVGSLIGVLLPFIFVKFKKDPAAASTPLITTLSDIIGTAIFLEIAHLMLM